jgi:hypothetical protein
MFLDYIAIYDINMNYCHAPFLQRWLRARLKYMHITHGLSKKYETIFFPVVSNGERVGKLSVAVEGTFIRTHDFLLPRNSVRCVAAR